MEKLIWECNLGGLWYTMGSYNLDEDGNLKGHALEFYETTKDMFRRTPPSQIGIGDSTGINKILLDVDDDQTLPLLEKHFNQ